MLGLQLWFKSRNCGAPDEEIKNDWKQTAQAYTNPQSRFAMFGRTDTVDYTNFCRCLDEVWPLIQTETQPQQQDAPEEEGEDKIVIGGQPFTTNM